MGWARRDENHLVLGFILDTLRYILFSMGGGGGGGVEVGGGGGVPIWININ